jgi:hypothetical protein
MIDKSFEKNDISEPSNSQVCFRVEDKKSVTGSLANKIDLKDVIKGPNQNLRYEKEASELGSN